MIFLITGFRVLSVIFIVAANEACPDNMLLYVVLFFNAYFSMLIADALTKFDK